MKVTRGDDISVSHISLTCDEIDAGDSVVMIGPELVRVHRDGVERWTPEGYKLTPWEDIQAIGEIVVIKGVDDEDD